MPREAISLEKEGMQIYALPSEPCPAGSQWLGMDGGEGEREEGSGCFTLKTLRCRKSVVGGVMVGGRGGKRMHYAQNLVLQEVSGGDGGGGGWRRKTDLCITLRTLSCRKSAAQNRSAGCVGWSVMD